MDVDVSLDYGLTLLAALLIGTGFVLQQHAAQREPASRFLSLRLMMDLARTPRWLVGIACMVGGMVLAAWSIGHLSLSFVEPLLTTNLVFALVLAVPLAKASVKFWEVFGAAVLCTGVALLSSSRSVKPIGLSFGSVSHWPAAAAIAFIAFVAVQAGRRRQSRTRAMLTGVGAGLIFGIQDALTRIPKIRPAPTPVSIARVRRGRGPDLRYPGRADQADAADPPVQRMGQPAHHVGAVRAGGRGRDRHLADAERVQLRPAPGVAAGHLGGRAASRHPARCHRVRRPDPGIRGHAGDPGRGHRRARRRGDHGGPCSGTVPAPLL